MSTRMIRRLARQRAISLYQDQEERIEKLLEKDIPLTISDIVRKGVDLVLTKIEEELKDMDE